MDEIETLLRKWKNKIKGNDIQALLSTWRGLKSERGNEFG
jgi:hypothetical protein